MRDGTNQSASNHVSSPPITLLFGEKDPFISLISLLLLDARDPNFRAIPPYASAMIFELFSTGASSSFPSSEDDLWVRFYYHNGTTDFKGQLMAFPLFNRGPSSTDMKWTDFEMMFKRIMMDNLVAWCQTCSSPALFCTGVDTDTIYITRPKSQVKTGRISPAVAGVIGAIVTLVLLASLFSLAILLFGIRFHRSPRRSSLGGFKGSAKLASDADITNLPKNGATPAGRASRAADTAMDKDKGTRHERVGSWELRQKEFGKDGNDGGGE